MSIDPELGLRLNDSFGPRIQTSSGLYDFHRGVDISRAVGTQVVAVADGEVTIAGEHASYQDTTAQIRHTLEDGTFLISHYTHLFSVTEGLEVGDVVRRGAPIASSAQLWSAIELTAALGAFWAQHLVVCDHASSPGAVGGLDPNRRALPSGREQVENIVGASGGCPWTVV